MTKMKSKKMTNSTFAIIIMAIAMVAMLAFGGTYAYFTAQTTAVSPTTTTGRVQLGANSVATLTQQVVPGQELLSGDVTVTSNSTVDTYVFITFSASIEKAAGDDVNTAVPAAVTDTPDAEGEYKLVATPVTGWNLIADSTTVYYKKVTANTATPITVCSSIKFDGYSVSTESLKGSLMDATITVTIDSSAIQCEGFTSIGEGEGFDYETEAEAAKAAYAFANIVVG